MARAMRFAPLALPCLLFGCVTVSDVTVAPFPCRLKVWPVPPADLIPREPQDGVCFRARLQQ